ncbi:pentapeptide repeat-containing protein [Planococcus sp. FY231025]|uniref:pentapeptide repeat-containing protein n=1 Tax=Planococcus sp. FY231025 TaxID=3455699 RepID=UPI003F92BEFB
MVNDPKQIRDRSALRADCSQCAALCCVGLAYAASADFAFSKKAGVPCPNLQSDFRCGIHSELRRSGFKGCTVFDCFGSGQKMVQETFQGLDWRSSPDTAAQMFRVFPLMTQLHEILWYLAEAIEAGPPEPLAGKLVQFEEETERLTSLGPEGILGVDIAAHRQEVSALLMETSGVVRKRFKKSKKKLDRRNADLMGAELKGADFSGVDFRGAYFIAANLRKADFTSADLLGADFRDADISGADLSSSLFLTQTQANAAIGDCNTKLPVQLVRPAHWAKKPRDF